MIDFDRLIPQARGKNQDKQFNNLLYIILIDWKWNYETFLNTPIPIINRCLKIYNEVKKAEQRAAKRKK